MSELDGPVPTQPRRRPLTLFAVVASASLLAACGSSGDKPAAEKVAKKTAPAATAEATAPEEVPGDVSRTDVNDVQQTVSDYMTAFADGDGESACNLMTDAAIADVVQDGKERTVDEAFDLCTDTIQTLGELLEDAEREQLRAPEFTDTKLDGDTATVTVAGIDDSVDLERTDDGWLLSKSPS